jgi:hypothetical protein
MDTYFKWIRTINIKQQIQAQDATKLPIAIEITKQVT